jgi:hypothetical protein
MICLLLGLSAGSLHAVELETDLGADDGSAVSVTTAVPAEPAVPPGCRSPSGTDPRWFDRAQGYFSERSCRPAVWFDRFFGGERASDDVASAFVRLIPGIQYSDRDFSDTSLRLKARFNLPNLENRFNLVINGEDDQDSRLLPGEVERPENVDRQGLRDSTAALRYLVQLADRSGADFDVGLRSEAKVFVRGRYYYTWDVSQAVDTRFTQTVQWRDGEGASESSLFEIERLLSEEMLLRVSSQVTLSELLNGAELREGVQVYRQIDADRAISWNLAMSVLSDPAWKADVYQTSIRYRQRFLRSWLFYEVEPFLDWARVDNFNTNPGIALRLEIWMGDMSGAAGGAAPVQESPVQESPVQESPVQESPVQESPVQESPVQESPATTSGAGQPVRQ